MHVTYRQLYRFLLKLIWVLMSHLTSDVIFGKGLLLTQVKTYFCLLQYRSVAVLTKFSFANCHHMNVLKTNWYSLKLRKPLF